MACSNTETSLEAVSFGPITSSMITEIDAETQEATRQFLAMAQQATPLSDMDPVEARKTRQKQYLAEHAAHFGSETTVPPQRQDRTITHGDHSVHVSIFRPTSTANNEHVSPLRGVYLHMHGGCWYFGEAAWQNDIRLCRICDQLQIAIVSVDYRLAPEHCWPAPLDDCVAAALWLASSQEAKTEFGTTTPLLIGGESAGGHLCMCTILQLHEKLGLAPSDPLPYRCANMVYGVYDLDGTPSMRNYGSRRLVFNYDDFIKCSAMLLSKKTSAKDDADAATLPDRRSPDISPIYANLLGKNLPPALFSVGTDDALLDDSTFMANRWAASGNLAKLAVYPGGAHGIGHFGPHANSALGRQCHARIEAFLSSHLT